MANEISPYIQENVLILSHKSEAKVAARALTERRVGSAVIVGDHGEVCGLVTDRDLVSNLLARSLPSETPISEVMTPGALVVSEDATLQEAIELMIGFGVRRVPVVKDVGERSRCVGILCLDDLIVGGAIATSDLVKIVRSQVRRRTKKSSRFSLANEERKEQTLGRFFNLICTHTGMSREVTEMITRVTLHALLRRVPCTAAAHFISQMPALLQDELFDLPAGPDPAQDPTYVTEDICKALNCNLEQCQEIIFEAWSGISEFLKTEPHRVALLRSIPEDWRALLLGGNLISSQVDAKMWEHLAYPHHIF